MPSADLWLLPACVVLASAGLVFTGVAWRRGRSGRVLQGIALTLAPVGLYLSGLLRLLWDAGAAVVEWATSVVLSPPVWAGLGLLALGLVLWLVGAVLVRRAPQRSSRTRGGQVPDRSKSAVTAAAQGKGVAGPKGGKATAAPQAQKGAASEDDDMAEIEALLKARGIE